MLNLIKKHVNSYFEMHNQDSIANEKIVYLNVANGLVDGHCFLFFGETSDFPIVVAKGACSQEGKAIYKREFDNLCKLQECGINTERQTTPKPLGIWNEDGMLITLQSALRGTLLKNIPGKELFSKKR